MCPSRTNTNAHTRKHILLFILIIIIANINNLHICARVCVLPVVIPKYESTNVSVSVHSFMSVSIVAHFGPNTREQVWVSVESCWRIICSNHTYIQTDIRTIVWLEGKGSNGQRKLKMLSVLKCKLKKAKM